MLQCKKKKKKKEGARKIETMFEGPGKLINELEFYPEDSQELITGFNPGSNTIRFFFTFSKITQHFFSTS